MYTKQDIKAVTTHIADYKAPNASPNAITKGSKIHLVMGMLLTGATVIDIQSALAAYDTVKGGKGSPADLAYARTWLAKSWVGGHHGYGMTFGTKKVKVKVQGDDGKPTDRTIDAIMATLQLPPNWTGLRLRAVGKQLDDKLAAVFAANKVKLPTTTPPSVDTVKTKAA